MKVSFHRTCSNHEGEPYEASLMSIEFTSATDADDAILMAIEQFQHAYAVSHWRLAAERYRIQ